MTDPDAIYIAGRLEKLRDTTADYIAGRSSFASVSVFTRRTANLANEMETLLGKIGVCAEVAIAAAAPRSDSSAAVCLDVTLLIEITEDVLVNQRRPNGTGKGALLLAESAYTECKMWRPPIEGGGVLTPRKDGILMPPVNTDKYPTTFVTQVFFTTALSLMPRSDA